MTRAFCDAIRVVSPPLFDLTRFFFRDAPLWHAAKKNTRAVDDRAPSPFPFFVSETTFACLNV